MSKRSTRLLAVLALAAACGPASNLDRLARRQGSARLGVPAEAVRVTERSELSTRRHAVLRVSTWEAAPREVTIFIPRDGGDPLDPSIPDAFDRVARAEVARQRLELVGVAHLAGWFGALGGGGKCGEPLSSEQPAATPVPGGGLRITYRFAAVDRLGRCTFEVAADGTLREAAAELEPMARK